MARKGPTASTKITNLHWGYCINMLVSCMLVFRPYSCMRKESIPEFREGIVSVVKLGDMRNGLKYLLWGGKPTYAEFGRQKTS